MCLLVCLSLATYAKSLPLSLPTPHTRIEWIGCEVSTMPLPPGASNFSEPSFSSSVSSFPSLPHWPAGSEEMTPLPLPLPPLPPTALDSCTMHLLTAFELFSGVSSSSRSSTEPKERTWT